LQRTIAAYATHIDNLEVLHQPVPMRYPLIQHRSFNIHQDQYDIVGHHLIETCAELAIPDAFTKTLKKTWLQLTVNWQASLSK